MQRANPIHALMGGFLLVFGVLFGVFFLEKNIFYYANQYSNASPWQLAVEHLVFVGCFVLALTSLCFAKKLIRLHQTSVAVAVMVKVALLIAIMALILMALVTNTVLILVSGVVAVAALLWAFPVICVAVHTFSEEVNQRLMVIALIGVSLAAILEGFVGGVHSFYGYKESCLLLAAFLALTMVLGRRVGQLAETQVAIMPL